MRSVMNSMRLFVVLLLWKPCSWYSTRTKLFELNRSATEWLCLVWKIIVGELILMNLCQPALGVQVFWDTVYFTCMLKPTRIVASCDPVFYWVAYRKMWRFARRRQCVQRLACRATLTSVELLVLVMLSGGRRYIQNDTLCLSVYLFVCLFVCLFYATMFLVS